MSRILFINTHAARHGWYFGRRMPKGYRLAAKFWGSGLIDRTRTLYTGFPYETVYPMPALGSLGPNAPPLDMNALCDESGRRIVAEALHAGKDIQVLWSGGIDSTVALLGVVKAAAAVGYTDRIEVLLTQRSIEEYPAFFPRFVAPLRHRFVTAPVTSHLDPAKLVVTGEHGDQIFGSAKIGHYVSDGRAFKDWRSALPSLLAEALESAQDADTVLHYVEPLFHAAPVKLRNVFDAFWWINFTLKWQIVGMRLAVFRTRGVKRTFEALRHYFSHSSFQLWALTNPDKKIRDTWESYKMPLKDYIFGFTGDNEYRLKKVKVPSLKEVFITDTQERPPSFRVLMDEEFKPRFWEFSRKR